MKLVAGVYATLFYVAVFAFVFAFLGLIKYAIEKALRWWTDHRKLY